MGKKKKRDKHDAEEAVVPNTPKRGQPDVTSIDGSLSGGVMPFDLACYLSVHRLREEKEDGKGVTKAHVVELDFYAHGRKAFVRVDRGRGVDYGSRLRFWVEDDDGRHLLYDGEAGDLGDTSKGRRKRINVGTEPTRKKVK